MENIRFYGTIEGGFYWDELCRQRMKNPKSLEPYGYKVYSQNDEDGIIHEIFKRIGTTNKKFIEFGVQNGLESNCHLLLFYGWSGYWFEGSGEFCRQIRTKFKPLIEEGRLAITNAFITRENINELFKCQNVTGEIDLLSIDIDGNDWYIWDAITSVNPRVVVIEYNGKFPPDLEWKQAYDMEHVWNGSDWHGASLKAYEVLGRLKGYQLAGTDLHGCDAFFVRKDLAGDLFYEPATSEALYNPLRMNLQFAAGHPAKYCLALQKDNLGILNYEDYALVSGFHKEECADGKEKHAWTSALTSRMRLMVAGGASRADIPVRCLREVLDRTPFDIVINCTGQERYRFAMDKPCVICNIPLGNMAHTGRVLDITMEIPFMWKPCDYINTRDERMLGVDVVLSEIKIY